MKTVENFENSKYGKRIKKYKDKYKGKRCFVLGNGPSLSGEDLTKLAENGEITFATNRVYKIFESTNWRPTFYVCEDVLIIKEKQKEINAIESVDKFIPINLNWYDGVSVDNACYFWMNYNPDRADEFNFSPNMARQLNCAGTVTFTSIQIAAYMGFSEIYLLGVDHNYSKIIDENGNVVEDNNVSDYFCKDYDNDIKDIAVHDIGKNNIAYINAKKYADMNNIKIYNATRGGKLEVFPRVNFDELF